MVRSAQTIVAVSRRRRCVLRRRKVTATSPRPSDDEVVAFLDRAHRDFAEAGAIDAAADPPLRDEGVSSRSSTGGRAPDCPRKTQGIVVFAHGKWQQPHSDPQSVRCRGLDRGRV